VSTVSSATSATTTSSTTASVGSSASVRSGAQTLTGKVTPGHPCGSIQVQAKVLHPTRGTSFKATATAHFASGDVTITLRRSGRSFVALGKIAVPGGQPAGKVMVDISITYGGTTTVLKTASAIN
jgi:hypothetical protein